LAGDLGLCIARVWRMNASNSALKSFRNVLKFRKSLGTDLAVKVSLPASSREYQFPRPDFREKKNGVFLTFFPVSFRRAETAISEGEQVFPAVFSTLAIRPIKVAQKVAQHVTDIKNVFRR
jgi:hypothetical protein